MAFQKPLLHGRLLLIAYLIIGKSARINCLDYVRGLDPRLDMKWKFPATSTVHTTTLSTANNTEYDTAVNYNLSVTEPYDYNRSSNVHQPHAHPARNDPPVTFAVGTLEPYDYNVEIRFFFEDNILFGQCSISMHVHHPLQSIKMNSVPIHIMEAFLIKNKSTNVYKFSSFTNYNDILAINFSDEVPPAVYTLNVTYVHFIHENDTNIFLSEYQANLIEQRLNETGVEVMKAQQLFPFVESVNRSRFKIAIKHHKKYTILSNMPIQAQYKNNKKDMMWTYFDESLLFTQHLSIVITTFTNVSSEFANVTIWCRESARQHVHHAINIAETVVPYFIQKYMINLSKLDIIALWHPHSKNYATLGLVLQRETDIIYNGTLHSCIRKREVTHMIARQLAFVWCYDTVIWSKEGFATFFGAYILDEVYPKKHMMDLMVVQAQQDSLRYDTSSIEYSPTLNSTNTFKVNLLGPQPNNMKSFIIWRMLYHLIPDVFWTGIHKYINEHRIYSNMTTADDLWTTMQTIYNKKYPMYMLGSYLKEIITNWITKEYYFVVKGTQHIAIASYLDLEISYMPSLYLLDYNIPKIWIPITYTSQSTSDFNLNLPYLYWITSNEKTKNIINISNNESNWFIINIQQIGYYRINYDFENWRKLMRYLNSEDYNKIHILNRAQVIDDAFYFFLQRQLSYNLFWNLTNFVLRDTNYVTWYPMIKVFESLTCIYPLEYGKEITEQMKNRIDQLLTKIGYFVKPDDDILTIYLRQEAVKWACILGIPECQRIAASELKKEFENLAETSNVMMTKWIYCRDLITTVNYTIWYEIRDKWIATSDKRFLEYLTCFEDSNIICNFLEITLLEKVQPNESKRNIRRANAFLFTVAKHAKKDELHPCLFKIIENFILSSNKRNDLIATLIVIITHVHSRNHMAKIKNGTTNVLSETQLLEGVKTKMKKRKSEYGRLIRNYGYYFSALAESETT